MIYPKLKNKKKKKKDLNIFWKMILIQITVKKIKIHFLEKEFLAICKNILKINKFILFKIFAFICLF